MSFFAQLIVPYQLKVPATLLSKMGLSAGDHIRVAYVGCSCQPSVETSENAFKITLTNVNYEAETTVQKNPLPEREQQMLEFISAKQPVSRAEIEAAMRLSQSVTVRTLKKLLELGLIQKSGGGKNTVYFQEKESDDDGGHKN